MGRQVKILADYNIPKVEALFNTLGHVELVDGRKLGAQQLRDVDVLLVRSVTQVDRTLLQDSGVSFVGSATAGFDHIDIGYLAERDITLSLASGANAESVVEYVIAAICSQPRFLDAIFRGAPVGIVGFGHVGSRLARVLHALGVKVKVYDPYVDCGVFGSDLDTVLACTVVSLHCELSKQGDFPSWHLLDSTRLQSLHSDQLLINAARGGVIDNIALLERLHMSDAPVVILDCWEGEPDVQLDLVPLVAVATPHIAGYSYDGKIRGSLCLRDDLARFLGKSGGGYTELKPARMVVDAATSVAALLKHLISSVYRIEKDDQAFRYALTETNTQLHWFDQLRRDYPVRRELLGAEVLTAHEDAALSVIQRCFRLQLIWSD